MLDSSRLHQSKLCCHKSEKVFQPSSKSPFKNLWPSGKQISVNEILKIKSANLIRRSQTGVVDPEGVGPEGIDRDEQ